MVALSLLLGLAGGVVLAAVAGARRTQTALPRFLANHGEVDVFVIPNPGQDLDLDQVEHLPQVAAAARAAYMGVLRRTPQGPDPDLRPFALITYPSLSTSKLIAGRRARPARADEVTVNEEAARRLALRPGSRLALEVATAEEVQTFVTTGQPPDHAQHLTFTVVGVEAAADEVASPGGGSGEVVNLTPAFFRAHAGSALFQASEIRLRHGDADVRAFTTATQRLSDQPVPFEIGSQTRQKREQAIHPQMLAVALFAAFAALAAAVVVGQSLARQVELGATDDPVLRALGMTTGQVVAVALVRAAMVAAAGAVLAIGVAVALSPLTPVGLARQAEPHPGVAVNAAVLGLGALAIAAFVVVRSWPTALRQARSFQRPRPTRSSIVADRVSGAGAPAPAVLGVRMAFEPGSGGTAVPVRSALLGGVVAVAALGTALIFATSLDHASRTPRVYGYVWDLAADGANGPDLSAVAPAVRHTPGVASVAGLAAAQVTVGGRTTAALSFTGSGRPPIVSGRQPRGDDEVAVGAKTLRRLHTSVGRAVVVSSGGRRRTMHIVGRVVVPPFGVAAAPPFGDAIVLTLDGLRAVSPEAPVNFFLVRLRPGADGEKVSAAVGETIGADVSVTSDPLKPVEIDNLTRVNRLPFVLSAVLAVLFAATLAHALVTSTRRRRRDLAVLKVLGFSRRQVSATIAWQATAVTLAVLVVGLPLGIAGGRAAWGVYAGQLGLVDEPTVPWLLVLLSVPAALLTANLLAAGPGWMGARIRPAVALRTE